MDLTVTDRTAFFAALAAAAVLAFPASEARADTAAPEAETPAGETQATVTPTPVENEAPSGDAIAAEGVLSAPAESTEPPATPEPPAEPQVIADPGDGGGGPSETPPPTESGTASPPAEASDDSQSEASGPAAEAGSTVSVIVTDEVSQGAGQGALPATPTGGPAKPSSQPPAAIAPTAKGEQVSRGGLGRLLPQLDRELGAVESEIEQLRRGLEHGLVPPARRLQHLRSSLNDLEPALLALSTQLHGADQLSPRLRRLLTRVRTRLGTVRASAADLSLALRHSGIGGPELRRLLQELDRFGELTLSLGLPAGIRRAAVLPARATQPPAPPALARPSAAAPPHARLASGPAIGAPERGGGEPAPPSPAPGSSSTAAPAGAFAVAGLALLALLLVSPSLSRLRTRLDLPPCRGYAVAFLTPLERPG